MSAALALFCVSMGLAWVKTVFHLHDPGNMTYTEGPSGFFHRPGAARMALLAAGTVLWVGWTWLFWQPQTRVLGGFALLIHLGLFRQWEKSQWQDDIVVYLGKYVPTAAALLGYLGGRLVAEQLGHDNPEWAGWQVAIGFLGACFTLAGISKWQEAGKKWFEPTGLQLLIYERGIIAMRQKGTPGPVAAVRKWVGRTPWACQWLSGGAFVLELVGFVLLVPELRIPFTVLAAILLFGFWVLLGYFELEWGLSVVVTCWLSLMSPSLEPVLYGGVPLAPPADASLGLTPYEVPLPAYMEALPVPADNPLTHAGVSLGRYLFYDPLLSGNDELSCATCHEQALSFTDGKPVSVGISGVPLPRNAMPLVNLAWTAPYFWDGRAPTLEALVPQPIVHPDELGEDLDNLVAQLSAHPDYPDRFAAAFPGEPIGETTISKAIAQFLRTLVSFNAPADGLDAGTWTPGPLQMRGNGVMSSALPRDAPDAVVDICDACHKHSAGVLDQDSEMGLFTISESRSNGLDAGRFVVPTIRNLAVTGPYMHDGRFDTLLEVAQHYNTGLGASAEDVLVGQDGAPRRLGLNTLDEYAVAAILEAFTDEAFLHNPAYSDPFATP